MNELVSSKPVQTVRLLPYFDPYTIAIARHSDALLPAARRTKSIGRKGGSRRWF